jgi:hypothetical protein
MTENQALQKENLGMKAKLQQISDLLEDFRGDKDSSQQNLRNSEDIIDEEHHSSDSSQQNLQNSEDDIIDEHDSSEENTLVTEAGQHPENKDILAKSGELLETPVNFVKDAVDKTAKLFEND